MGASNSGVAKGWVESVMILQAGAEIVSTELEQVKVSMDGFEGDRHAGKLREAGGRDPKELRGTLVRNTRQVSLVAEEELEEIARRLEIPRVEPRWLGANLSLRGIPGLSRLPQGTRLVFERGTVIVIDEENSPCTGPGEAIAAAYGNDTDLAARFPKEAMHLRGLVGWVDRPGEIRQGDQVETRPPADGPASTT